MKCRAKLMTPKALAFIRGGFSTSLEQALLTKGPQYLHLIAAVLITSVGYQLRPFDKHMPSTPKLRVLDEC